MSIILHQIAILKTFYHNFEDFEKLVQVGKTKDRCGSFIIFQKTILFNKTTITIKWKATA